MRQVWTLVWQPDDTRLTPWISRLPAHSWRAGPLLLAANLELERTVDVKAVGAWEGVVFNDRQAAEPLIGRGAPIADGAALVVHALGWFGLAGLGALRWHGTLAVVNPAQRMALVARDWQGVGGLYAAADGDGWVLSNDCEHLHRVGLRPRLVPPGMLAMCAPTGLRWQAIPTQADGRAWFRDLPDELAQPSPTLWQDGLRQRLDAAVAACQRAYPRIAVQAPSDAVGHWLTQRHTLPSVPDPDALWALDGADAWLGRSDAVPVEPVSGPWPPPEPPEPLRVDAREAHARRVRATWLADVALERARSTAQQRHLPIVAPHLDPAVLAWLGAMPTSLRPLA